MRALSVVLVPFMAAAGVLALRRRRRAFVAVAVAAPAATLVLGATAAQAAAATFTWGGALELRLAAVGPSRLMAVLVPAVALPVIAYAATSERHDAALARLLGLMVAFVAAMELLVLAADFLTLLLAWELVGACSWALIGHRWAEAGVARAAGQAFVTTRAGDLGLYLAAGAAYAAGGSFAFSDLPVGATPELHVVAAGVVVAAAAKSAQVPFSPWLFSAMAGPTPVSALLHSATMVAAGAYAVAKLAPALEPTGWFLPAVAALGAATALAGGVVAAVQPDVKKVLAASTSAQYGLVLVAVGAGSIAAGLAHLATHAAFKALLFLAAGVALHASGTGQLARLRLGSVPRATAALAGVGTVFLAGVPPVAGWSKEQVLAAASHRSWWLAAGVVAAGVLGAFYAGRLQLLAFGTGRRGRGGQHRPPGTETAAMAVLAAACLGLGAAWLPWGRRLLRSVASGAVSGLDPGELAVSAGVVVAALAAVWVANRRGALYSLGLGAPRQAVVADWLGLPVVARRLVTDPVLALSRWLARVDDRVIDAGVRAAAAIAAGASRFLSWWGERRVDDVVHGVGGAALAAARGSRLADERGVDAAVEGVAAGVGVAGTHSRRAQTGLAHQYYVIAAVGVALVVVAAALGTA